MATEPADNPFWRFSLAVYGRPGVPAACLTLQDRCGLDVNLVLFVLWAGAGCAARLTAQQVARIDRAVSAWRRDVVVPLRGVRRRLKHGPAPAPSAATAALRAQLKTAELEAERLMQTELSRLGGLLPAAAASDNERRMASFANLALLIEADDGLGREASGILLTAALAVRSGLSAEDPG